MLLIAGVLSLRLIVIGSDFGGFKLLSFLFFLIGVVILIGVVSVVSINTGPEFEINPLMGQNF